MTKHLFLLAVCFCYALSATGQVYEETEYVVIDRGNQMNGSDGGLRVYTHTGTLLETLNLAGSGQLRGGDMADTGELYVARGNDIWRYTGNPLTADMMPFATGTKAQDVVVNPVTGNIFCSFGSNAGEASILELDPTGAIVQMLTDPLFVHPRSIAMNFGGDTLFIANQTAGNVLTLDIATSMTQVHADLTAAIPSFGPIGITVPRDRDDLVYVVSDYGSGPTQIVEVSGPTGSTSVNTFIDFSMLSDMRAPAGAYADNYGNLFIAGRSKNMGVPGIYIYNRETAQRRVLPYLNAEHVNPIDICFAKTPITFEVVSSDGISTNTGVPQVLFGTQNTQLVFNIQAPDYANMPYAILYSLMDASVCQAAAADPLRPVGGGLPFEAPDSRTAPILADEFFIQSLALIQAGGTGAPVLLSPASCPDSQAGFFLHPQGLIDGSGAAQAILTMPSLPCLPPNFVAYMAFSLFVVDGQTQPSMVGVSTSRAVCVSIERP